MICSNCYYTFTSLEFYLGVQVRKYSTVWQKDISSLGNVYYLPNRNFDTTGKKIDI